MNDKPKYITSEQEEIMAEYSYTELTFMALTRTNSIFCGLVLLLVHMKHLNSSILILILCISIQIYASIVYLNQVKYYNSIIKKYRKDPFIKYHTIILSFILCFILILLLMIIIRTKFLKLKYF